MDASGPASAEFDLAGRLNRTRHSRGEVSGAKPAMETAIDILRPRGEVIGIGLGAFDDLYQYNHAGLVAEEKAIRGCFMVSWVPDRDIPRFVCMLTFGQLPVDRLRSDTITLKGINRAFDKLASGQVVRQIILRTARFEGADPTRPQ